MRKSGHVDENGELNYASSVIMFKETERRLAVSKLSRRVARVSTCQIFHQDH